MPKLKQITTSEGRKYVTPQGISYPSVTTITGLLSNKSIAEWRAKVGDKEANRVSKAACARGTKIHFLCECYLKDIPYDVNIYDRDIFYSIIPFLNNINNIYALESGLYSDYLKSAGTVDCIAEYNNELSVIDFKTSKRIKSKDSISGYFMQCAAYGYMFWERTGILIKNLVIIMGVDDDKPQIFKEPIVPWLNEFIVLRREYEKI